MYYFLSVVFVCFMEGLAKQSNKILTTLPFYYTNIFFIYIFFNTNTRFETVMT